MKQSTSWILNLTIILMLCTDHTSNGFQFVPENREVVYEYVGTVSVGAQAPMENDNSKPPPSSGWKIRGTLKLQRRDNVTLAAALAYEKIILNNSGQIFYQNKEMLPIYHPFKIVYSDDVVDHLRFKEKDSLWSTNFKRAIASALQVQGHKIGAFVEFEPSIHGNCTTEYYVARSSISNNGSLSVKKTTELNSCKHTGGVHYERSNVPINPCDFDFQKNVIVGNEALYEMNTNSLDNATGTGTPSYYLSTAHVKGLTMVQTFESTGEAQYISSEIWLTFVGESDIVNALDIDTGMAAQRASIEYLDPGHDITAGRQLETSDKLIKDANALFGTLADNLLKTDLNFEVPYDSSVADIIHVMGQMDFEALEGLYNEIDIGTSYRQETIQNVFHEIVPRIGTKASVLLTRNLIMRNSVKPTTAIQLLISLPFHIAELSHELVIECEVLLGLGPDRPDVTQAAVLSFATLVHHTRVAGKIDEIVFEKYVKKYFELFMKATNFETKMVYMQGLGNLKIGNVADYLDPIIRDENENTDLRYLAIMATMPLARSRAEKVYETYWPLFQNQNTTLELRIAAFSTLLLSNPTPARLMSLHKILQDESSSHIINYYRTTILSMSGTTHPCYQDLKRLLSYMSRHIPQPQPAKFWTTGQYLYDYRDSQYGIGAMLQTILIGDAKTNEPYIGHFEFHTEALGKFSSQLTLYIKARGVSDKLFERHNLAGAKLVDFLRIFKTPYLNPTPFHLEIIVKTEGMSVMSFFLNQKTIQNLSQQELMILIFNRILADTHINMQTIRWPFMLQYSVPTILGTPAEVTIQSTVLISLRGNITQIRAGDNVAKTHEIDARYSSYAVCKSNTYNPFLNFDHTINREQGFLVYVPINNELSWSLFKTMNFSFYRPADVTGGASLKSRSLTSTKGFMLSSDKVPYSEILLPDTSSYVPLNIFHYELADLGLNVTAQSTFVDLTNHLAFLFQSDLKENTKVLLGKNSVMDFIIMLAGIVQLNAMHIGNNKNFSFLLHNAKSTKIDGSISEVKPFEYALNLRHNSESDVLHVWDAIVDANNITEIAIELMIERLDTKNHKAHILMKGVYKHLILFKRSFSFDGFIEFASQNELGINVTPVARITFKTSAGFSDQAVALYNNGTFDESETTCPRQMLRFNPPPSVKYCDKEAYREISTLSQYAANIRFSNMPVLFQRMAHRFEHFISAFADDLEKPMDYANELNVSLDVRRTDLTMTMHLNDERFVVPNVLRYLKQLEDVKYDTFLYYALEYGLTTMCSGIKDQLSTFNDEVINLRSHLKEDCTLLLFAECTRNPHYAVFLTILPNQLYGFTVYHLENVIEYRPDGPEAMYRVKINGNETQLLPQPSLQLSAFELDKVNVYITEENILVIQVIADILIQYDMKDIFTVQRLNENKERLCGICNLPINPLDTYSSCG